MILTLQILFVIILLAFAVWLIKWGWRKSKITQHGAQENMLKGFNKDWKE